MPKGQNLWFVICTAQCTMCSLYSMIALYIKKFVEHWYTSCSFSDLTINWSWGPAFAFFWYFFWNLGKLWLNFAQRHLDVLKCVNGINAAFTKFTLPSNITIVRLPILFDILYTLSLDRTYLVSCALQCQIQQQLYFPALFCLTAIVWNPDHPEEVD